MQAKPLALLRAVVLEVLLLEGLYASGDTWSRGWFWAILGAYSCAGAILYWVDARGLLSSRLRVLTFLVDLAAASAALTTMAATTDIYLAYFLVVLACCYVEDLRHSFVIGFVACLVYATLAFPGSEWTEDPSYLLRTSLLLATAFLASCMADAARRSTELVLGERYEQKIAWMQRLSMTGQALAAILHELKTPMGTIVLSAEHSRGLLERDRKAEVAEHLKVIENEAERATDILRQYLEFLRPAPLELAPLTVQEPLSQAIDALRLRMEERGIALALEQGAAAVIQGSRRHLVQVFSNIVLNAVDAMPLGGTLTVRVKPEGGAAVVSMRDTGAGMEPEVLGRLFKPFVTSKDDYEGHGLGLSIARWIVERHGGSIAARSQGRGKGSEFVVTIPLSRQS